MAEESGIDGEARSALIQEIEDYFTGRVGVPVSAPAVPERGLRLATAVLLLEMSRADLEARHDEHRAVARALERLLGMGPAEALAAIRLAEDQLKLQLPLQHFTSLIDRHFSRDEKRRVVECLWRVAFSDAEILAHEEYLVRKVADQLHLPFEDFLLAKIQAREEFFGGA